MDDEQNISFEKLEVNSKTGQHNKRKRLEKVLITIVAIVVVGVGGFFGYKEVQFQSNKRSIFENIENEKFVTASNIVSELSNYQVRRVKDEVLNYLVVTIKSSYENMNTRKLGDIYSLSKQFDLTIGDWRKRIFDQVPQILKVDGILKSRAIVCQETNQNSMNEISTLASDALNDIVSYYTYEYSFYLSNAYETIVDLSRINIEDCDPNFKYEDFKWNIEQVINNAYNNPTYANLNYQLDRYSEYLQQSVEYKEKLLTELSRAETIVTSIDEVFRTNSTKIQNLKESK